MLLDEAFSTVLQSLGHGGLHTVGPHDVRLAGHGRQAHLPAITAKLSFTPLPNNTLQKILLSFFSDFNNQEFLTDNYTVIAYTTKLKSIFNLLK
jgi:hypothetical protein